MNEYDRLYRQAQRYREMYPEGTRILLLHMGDDPRPVEDDMRGTVKYVDDMCTLHCAFDNGRQLGLIPGEDSFRKLTEEELAEEQMKIWTRITAPLWECEVKRKKQTGNGRMIYADQISGYVRRHRRLSVGA